MIVGSLAPSSLAASMISSGTASSACLTRNVPKALTANGSTSAPIVFTSPTLDSSRKTGTKVTWPGIKRHPITRKKRSVFPRKRSLASAYPAGSARAIWVKAMSRAMTVVVRK
jgi:hypothetical protein